MNNEREKWIDEVFQSMKGSERAKPRPDLLAAIEDQIAASKARVIPMQQWKYAAAVAAIILLVNAVALTSYDASTAGSYEDTLAATTYGEPLISSYQIYGQ